jgi:hypothetical protein
LRLNVQFVIATAPVPQAPTVQPAPELPLNVQLANVALPPSTRVTIQPPWLPLNVQSSRNRPLSALKIAPAPQLLVFSENEQLVSVT